MPSASNRFNAQFMSAYPGEMGYAGEALSFEGGDSGMGTTETMPGQNVYPQKIGYDERNPLRPGGRGYGGNTVHGVPGVEGVPQEQPSIDEIRSSMTNGFGGSSDSGGGMTDDSDEDDSEDGMAGPACPEHGCGRRMKTQHGLARHIHAKHGGYGGLGRAMRTEEKKAEKHGMTSPARSSSFSPTRR